MHSCELITNLRAKKVLCHRIEVARISGATTTDCVFCNVIGYRRITPGKAINLMKTEESGGGHQTFFPRERAGSGHETSMLIELEGHEDGKCL